MAKILVVGKYYPPFEGGTEAYTRDVCEMLAAEHDVTAVVFNHEPKDVVETAAGVRVMRFAPQFTWKSQPIAFSMWKAIDLKNADLVHFHAPNFFANAILVVKALFMRQAPPVIVTHHMDVYGRKMIRKLVIHLYHALLRKASALIVTSEKYAKISKDLPKDVPFVAIPLGIELAHYIISDDERNAALKWKSSLAGDSKVIGFIGRHARYKGLHVLIEAISHIEGAHAIIAGTGPYRQAAIELAKSLGISERVHFVGYLSDAEKKRLFAASDVFAFPSTEVTEAFGVSQLEAMAAGAPVVSSDLPTGVTDVAVNEFTALLAPPGDAVALERCMRRVLYEPGLADKLKAGANAHLLAKFTKADVLEKTRVVMNLQLRKSDRAPAGTTCKIAVTQNPQ